MHGDKSQNERDYVLREFRNGRCPILVATDVAARGLGEFNILFKNKIKMKPENQKENLGNFLYFFLNFLFCWTA